MAIQELVPYARGRVRQKGDGRGSHIDDRVQNVVHSFALRGQEESRVMLELDVTNVFPITSAAVHVVLRALIATIGETS